MKPWRQAALVLICLLSVAVVILPSHGLAQSQQQDVPLGDPGLEARARQLMKSVRCVVCQAQSIAESDAGIAGDMRQLIRARIAAGKTDEEIRQYLAARYGDFVLFKPPFKATTALLWAGPLLLLGLGALVIIVSFRKRALMPPPSILSAEETRRVAAALQQDPEPATGPGHGSGA